MMFKTTIVAGLFLGVHLLSAIWHPNFLWGADLLYAYPGPVQLIFLVLGLMVIFPRAWESFLSDGAEGRFSLWGSSPLRYVSRYALVLVGCSLFVSLSSSVHLLGDGYLYLRELEKSVWNHALRADRAPLTFWLVRKVHDSGAGGSAEGAYRLISYLAGGIYLLLVPQLADVMGETRRQKNLVVGMMITGGFMQLFFGYVENYALLLPGMLAFLLSGLQVLRGRLPVAFSAALLGVLIPLHFFSVGLLPSLLVLGLIAGKETRGRVVNLVSVLVVPLVSIGCFTLIDFDMWSYVSNLGKAHFLSVFAEPDFYQPYRLLSPHHFLDTLNILVLAAPAAAMGLALLRWRSLDRSPVHFFLLSSVALPLLLVFLANPEIGAFRDWDVLSLPAIPLSVYVAYRLVGEIKDQRILIRTALVVCGTAALHTMLWVGINTQGRIAESRFVSMMESSVLSKHAGSYGWETLGTYYRLRGQTEASLRSYQNALAANPDNPRHWISVGNTFCDLDDYESGIKYLQKAIELKPDLSDSYSNLGTAYHGLGDFGKAVYFLEKSIELNPNAAGSRSNLGAAYYGLGEHRKAIEHLEKAIALDPGYGSAYANLGAAYHRIGEYQKAIESIEKMLEINPELADGLAYMNLGAACHSLHRYEEAVRYLQEAVRRRPGLVDAQFNLAMALIKLNRPREARPYFQTMLRLNPNDPQAETIRAWLRANP
jgi:tetratricopeptide (TPR) repeat protein